MNIFANVTMWTLLCIRYASKTTAVRIIDNHSGDIAEPEMAAVSFVGCNFSGGVESGVVPFMGGNLGPYTCEVPVSKTPVSFTYVCPGVSNPWACPTQVRVQGQKMDLESLVSHSKLKQQHSASTRGMLVHTVLMSQPHESFTAICTCETARGRLYTMKIVGLASAFRPPPTLLLILGVFSLQFVLFLGSGRQ